MMSISLLSDNGRRILKTRFSFTFALLACCQLQAALTEEQRVQDFQSLSAIYAKSYAPANWKLQALGINIFETGEWIKRVRAAKNDLEHVKVLMEYAASFKDTHTSVTMESNFLADLGFYCDLYDGKVVIDVIDRFLLPRARYPFAEGDEFVSLDGVPAIEVARELEKEQGWGNPRATLRYAISSVTLRAQYQTPLAVHLPDESTVVIRRRSGATETYRIKWDKSGFPIRDLGSTAAPRSALSGLALTEENLEPELDGQDRAETRPGRYLAKQSRLARYRVGRQKNVVGNEDGSRMQLDSVRGLDRPAPIWALPAGFVQRLGRGANDVFFTGTYISEGQRIGLLRIRNFSFYTIAQLNQLNSEIAYFNNNTDGLVVDVMRNPGGADCAIVEASAMLIPNRFTVDGVSIRPSLNWISYFDTQALFSEFFDDPQYFIDTFKFQRDLVVAAYNNGRGMTGSIPTCSLDFQESSYSFAYRKPMILLVDDFSTSAADSFAGMIQDNRRGKLVGMRTNGAGGNVNQARSGPWSETATSFTDSLVIRSVERSYEGFPRSPFIENVGVRPDIELDYMNVENIVNSGRPFVTAFTKIIVEEIRAARP
ncbi:MAG: hypothetical protein FJW36_08905 [Acidobacteria bacterium]|nr:hypothetical protein [Acidobacteriota bacterium]